MSEHDTNNVTQPTFSEGDSPQQRQIRQWMDMFSSLEFITTHELQRDIQYLCQLGYPHIATVIQKYLNAR